ncbi:MAG TPA: hypothetical protein VJP58_06675 [Candidatus Nitrosocosmicus sp.]|nr:hypothetical protein [Candidatus Nitrosocosmicus sp.]
MKQYQGLCERDLLLRTISFYEIRDQFNKVVKSTQPSDKHTITHFLLQQVGTLEKEVMLDGNMNNANIGLFDRN